MKNIHLIPTDKPSRLLKDLVDKTYQFKKEVLYGNRFEVPLSIYITSDEEIKEGDWYLTSKNTLCKCIKTDSKYVYSLEGGSSTNCKKIILSTDQDLIKDGVQEIDNEFLEWFVKNPSCESVEVETIEKMIGSFDGNGKKPIYVNEYKIIIPKEEPNQDIIMELQKDPLLKDFDNQVNKKISFLKQKQETLEEVAIQKRNELGLKGTIDGFIAGTKWQQEQDLSMVQGYLSANLENIELLKRSYSEEEVLELVNNFEIHLGSAKVHEMMTFKKWFEQFKKK